MKYYFYVSGVDPHRPIFDIVHALVVAGDIIEAINFCRAEGAEPFSVRRWKEADKNIANGIIEIY